MPQSPLALSRDLEELLDKQKLHENMMLYCRGQDRKDIDLMKSTYWPDSTDDHGSFVGNGHDFCEWAYNNQRISGHSALHHCGNTLIELNGYHAKRETVFMYVMVQPNTKQTFVIGGRYRDLCEKRAGQWKVLRRVCIWDWSQTFADNPNFTEHFGFPPTASYGCLYPDDAIYGEW